MAGEHFRVGIAGAGFSGIGAAIRLREAGITDFVVLERDSDVGGTWQANTYPGCACDVPSQLYSYSFALNPHWSRSFSAQPEIRAYLRRVAEERGIMPHVRLNTSVEGAEWDAEARVWRVQTSAGPMTADVVIACVGALAEPKLPDVPGIETFAGTTFHSARWNHEHDLRGRRVGVIGTGASSIQFVPRIAPDVAHLTLFQRTPAWIAPRLDRRTTTVERRLYRHVPGLQRLARAGVYWSREALVVGLAKERRLLQPVRLVARGWLHAQVRDRDLRRKLTPRYEIGCKRILISNDFYPSLMRDNVHVETNRIEEVLPDGIRTADGRHHAVDTLILGTGFHVTDNPAAGLIRGREGRSLAEAWAGSPQTYRGTTVHGFPNYFHLAGPNTGIGHTSLVYMIEAQLDYVMAALKHLERTGAAAIEVRADAQDAFNDDVQQRMEDTVWTAGGCASWYIDAQGRNTTLWPDFTFRYRQLVRAFEGDHHELLPHPALQPLAASGT